MNTGMSGRGEDEHHARQQIAAEDHGGDRQRDHAGQDELGQIRGDVGVERFDAVGQEGDEFARAPPARRHRALIHQRGEDPAADLVLDPGRRRARRRVGGPGKRGAEHDGAQQPAEARRHRRTIRTTEKDLGNDVRQQPRLDHGHHAAEPPEGDAQDERRAMGAGKIEETTIEMHRESGYADPHRIPARETRAPQSRSACSTILIDRFAH